MRSFFRSDALVVLVGLLLTNPVLAAAPAATNDRPNFVVIMVDDMGFSDPGCYGGEINTPNIDRLASDGLRFTQFYNCSRCCQTRASLLTGAYPERVGMRDFGRSMDADVPTLAENLRRGGYATSMSGKWHLTELPAKPTGAQRILWMNHELQLKRPFGNKATYPTRRGFENFYGIIWGVVDHFDPFSLTDGETPVADVPDDYYVTDAITSHAAQYIEDAVDADKPFFLYVAYTAPHWPIQAPAADISKYHGKYSDGWQSLRQQRFARQQELGLFDTSVPLGELSGRSPEWDNMSPEDREFEAAKMEVHAAMVDRVDQGIGKLIAELKRSGVYENTCILFLSDNGASPEIPGGPGYDRYSGTRDGRTAWRDAKLRRPENRAKLGTEESYTGIGHTWASAVNTPLRYWKMESYDGGCRTPMIVHWPQGIANRRGEFVADVGHVIDIAPTLYELSGVQPVAETLCDGTSLAPVLAGEPTLEPRHLFFQHGNGAGVRYGKWKASKRAGENWELFDLSQDPGETTNLASSHPDQFEELLSAWNTWQADLAGTTLDTAATSAAAKAAKQ